MIILSNQGDYWLHINNTVTTKQIDWIAIGFKLLFFNLKKNNTNWNKDHWKWWEQSLKDRFCFCIQSWDNWLVLMRLMAFVAGPLNWSCWLRTLLQLVIKRRKAGIYISCDLGTGQLFRIKLRLCYNQRCQSICVVRGLSPPPLGTLGKGFLTVGLLSRWWDVRHNCRDDLNRRQSAIFKMKWQNQGMYLSTYRILLQFRSKMSSP